MLPVPVTFVEKAYYSLEQNCKRAKNFIECLAEQRYTVSKNGWFRTSQYSVNPFGEVRVLYGNTENILERMLELDRISSCDYQLLKFYDLSENFKNFLDDLCKRKTEEDTIPVSMEELTFLRDIMVFEEDPEITKEEILSSGK